MKILLLTQFFYPAVFGGGEYIFYHWARDLVKKGHQVFVITQRLENTKSHEIHEGIDIFRVGKMLQLSGTLPAGISSNVSYMFNAFFKAMSITKKEKIDIIHSNTYSPVFAAQLCSTITNTPHIATIHDVYYTSQDDFWQKWSKQKDLPKTTTTLGPFIEKLVLKMPVNLFHTVSEKSKSDIKKINSNKRVVVIPNGLNPEIYSKNISKVKNQVIYVGRLVFYKNLPIIIESFKNVVREIPDATLIIVGDGPMKEELYKLTLKLNLEKNIVFQGNISDEQKIKAISESQILLNPSLVEGFGIVVLEGFACKKPVIVSDSKPLSELINDGMDGFIVKSDSVLEWSEKIIELMKNPQKAEKMGKSGFQKLCQNYLLSCLVDDLLHLYEDVIKS